MDIIRVDSICKDFQIVNKRSGMRGYIKDLFIPRYDKLSALNNVSFSVCQGEIVGLLGPNGAGKSTLIKLMTGILYPSSGDIQIIGEVPWKKRKKISKDIGTVFGQKSQLWFHLDLIDSLNVLEAIYEIPHDQFLKNKEMLIDTFGISKIATQPIRKLSLGQRMKCEIVAALIHNPKLIFLDEPTIGLDLVSKQTVRDVLLEINKSWGTTIVLTSHDTGDIDNMCERAIIINEGMKVIDDNLQNIKKKYVKEKNIKIQFKEALPKDLTIKNLKEIEKIDDNTIRVKIDVREQDVNISQIINQISTKGTIVDITLDEMMLEDIIKNIYINGVQFE